MDLYNASNAVEEDEPMVLSLEDYEDAKKSLQTIIDRADAARRLSENKDFDSLVMQGYLTDEPKRLAELMASGRLHKSTMEDCTANLDAIGKFRSYMKDMLEQGNIARDDLVSLEEARDEAIRQEAESVA
jgi:hypothetical protein